MLHIPGGVNLILILAVALIVFGPNKLPEIARTLARTMNDFRNAMQDVTQHFDLNSPAGGTRVHPGDEHVLGGGSYGGSSHYGRPADPHYTDPYAPDSSPEGQPSGPGGPYAENQSMNIG